MNPNANSFNPTGADAGRPAAAGGGARQDSFTQYQNMVENIEQEMDNEETNDLVESMNDAGINSNPGPPSTSTELPPHMKKHAAEFWFPESKDCTCCKGFKHGCQCSKSNNGICSVCCGLSTAPATTTTANTAQHTPPATATGGGSKIPCKFYRSPGGCRFGDNCRFAHF